jgi:starch synthase (maltosyl-transferring)
MVARIPITNVSPVIEHVRYPVKAVPGEVLTVQASVFREGHDLLGAGVVLTDPKGKDRPLVHMTELDFPNRYEAHVSPDAPGAWTYRVESWSDPYGTWRHAAEIKVPAEIDVELMFTEAQLLFKRAVKNIPTRTEAGKAARAALTSAAAAGRDKKLPAQVRLAALTSPDVRSVLRHFPLRDLVSSEGPYPIYVDRTRAL